MKVLHIISSGGMYGAEAVILNLSRTLRRGRIAVRWACSRTPQIQILQLHDGGDRSRIRIAPDSVQRADGSRGHCDHSRTRGTDRRGRSSRAWIQGGYLCLPRAARDGRAAGLYLPHLVRHGLFVSIYGMAGPLRAAQVHASRGGFG